ncbi:amino acid aminotransferase [Cupriavidus basilensis]|uniref:amino acid aminotransferase n=1 Tax=Cupriavidus basilensis TaxID=68895 RepID=UPI0023E75DB3|nr:amino acid aminotransferase [Cupriavidus basilensis]MDF3881296.1 aspartate/tyrosine/aromatic aminotransferase [Cupriavidus basilensis]
MFLSRLSMAPGDPILGLNEQYSQDPRPGKVNLAVGVYHDESGRIPLLDCVREAEDAQVALRLPRGYQPIDGATAFQEALLPVVFGLQPGTPRASRITTVQTVGGTSALRLAADFLHRVSGVKSALISDPTWENHRGVLASAGMDVGTYRYLPEGALQPDLDGLLADLEHTPAGTVVVLHACCHNPTGYDLPAGAWALLIDVMRRNGLIALLDIAYQGFGDGLDEDAAPVRQFMDSDMPCLVAISFSKNFSLYGERVGALSVIAPDAATSERVRSQLKVLIRTNYSNPPSHGAHLVSRVLSTAVLREQWRGELDGVRVRIQRMRHRLVAALHEAGMDRDLSFITRQKGMFSYSGLTVEEMRHLRETSGVYGVDSGRICIAALNDGNVDRVAQAIALACHPHRK